MDDWRRKLLDDLTEGFILREYQVLNPQMAFDFKLEAIGKYHNDSVFHARVDSIVAGVMALVDKHVPTGDASL